AAVDGGHQVGGGLGAHALQSGQGFGVQFVDVGDAVDEALLHQLLDQLHAETVDVHGGARGEVDDGLHALRAAEQPAAAADQYFALGPFHSGAAHGALGGRGDGPPVGPLFVAFRGDHLDDLGNDVAGAPQDHTVADHDAQAL